MLLRLGRRQIRKNNRQASNVVASADVTLTAKDNVTITSAAEMGSDSHYRYEKKAGIPYLNNTFVCKLNQWLASY